MTISTSPTSLVAVLDAANPNVVASALQQIAFGSFIRSLETHLRAKNLVTAPANPYVLATLQALTLPDDAKACTIARAYARVGTGTAGELTVAAFGATPTTGQIAVAPNGDIVTLATDAWTNLDVVYLPERFDMFELTLPVATNVLTIPTAYTAAPSGVILLAEAEALVGTAVGKKIVLVPGAGAPAAGQARLNIAKTTVTFASADAVTSARVKFAVVASPDVDALLEAASNLI